MELTRENFRPEAPDTFQLIESSFKRQELQVLAKGYCKGSTENDDKSATYQAIAKHQNSRLRGAPNLVFAESRLSTHSVWPRPFLSTQHYAGCRVRKSRMFAISNRT